MFENRDLPISTIDKMKAKNERLEMLLFNVCDYLIELNDEFLDFEHNEICFGVTEEEHKRYFLGE